MSDDGSSGSGISLFDIAWLFASLWALYKARAFWEIALSLESPLAEAVAIFLVFMWIEAVIVVVFCFILVCIGLFVLYCAADDYLSGRDVGVPGGDD